MARPRDECFSEHAASGARRSRDQRRFRGVVRDSGAFASTAGRDAARRLATGKNPHAPAPHRAAESSATGLDGSTGDTDESLDRAHLRSS
jgi:hypothetical protein